MRQRPSTAHALTMQPSEDDLRRLRRLVRLTEGHVTPEAERRAAERLLSNALTDTLPRAEAMHRARQAARAGESHAAPFKSPR